MGLIERALRWAVAGAAATVIFNLSVFMNMLTMTMLFWEVRGRSRSTHGLAQRALRPRRAAPSARKMWLETDTRHPDVEGGSRTSLRAAISGPTPPARATMAAEHRHRAPHPEHPQALLSFGRSLMKKDRSEMRTDFTLMPGMRSQIILVGKNVKLHVVDNEATNKPLMLFLHGFPECWYSWRYIMKARAREQPHPPALRASPSRGSAWPAGLGSRALSESCERGLRLSSRRSSGTTTRSRPWTCAAPTCRPSRRAFGTTAPGS